MEIFLIFATFSVLGLAACLLQISAVRSYSRESLPPETGDTASPPASPVSAPHVSILKPLKGLDDNLFDNLESFCLLDYPGYEIIFALQSRNDPAYKVAKKVRDKYPEIDITIYVEYSSPGLNPKVNNLIPAYGVSKYPYVLISDSNVMVDRSYLRKIMGEMKDPSVGLVCNLIRGMGGYSVGAVLENLHMNSFVIGSVCFLDRVLKMPCVIGKSMLMRKADLEAIGGLESVKDVLAEDYIIGKRMDEMGRKVVVSGHLINNVNNYWGIKKFINRHTRWGKLRWQIGGVRYISELIGNPVFMAFLPLLFWEPSRLTVAFAGIVSALKIAGDYMMGRAIKTNLTPSSYLFVPLKDLMIGIMWFAPLISSTVVWRGNRYIIGRESRLSPCPESGIWSLKYRLLSAITGRFA
jgi:ceramide glucosyltransferase